MRAWLQLFRLPNAFTVPGDALAGFILAGVGADVGPVWRLGCLIPASLCLYLGGLALNDWFDRGVDARERPDRPIPSGRIGAGQALLAGSGLLAAGVGLAAFAGTQSALVAAGIAGLVLLYDGPARRFAPAGFLVMGLCRGMNLLLGASVILPEIPFAALAAAAVETLYILAVTTAAKDEMHGPPRGLARVAPLFVLVFGLPAVLILAGPWWVAVAGAGVALLPVLLVVVSFTRDLPAAEVPPAIGKLLRALIPLQAAFALAGGAVLPAVGVYALWPLGRAAGRRFYGS